MSEPFSNSSWRWMAVALVVAAAVWLCYGGVKHALASHYGASSSSNDWPRAAEIEPSSAENWYRLGRYRQLDFDHPDLKLAIAYYRRAVELDPPSPFYKLDLATALEMAGDDAQAERYFRAAQANYPISAEVSWRYGNFLLRQQRLPEAYEEIHRAALVDSKLLPSAVSRAWRSNPDVRVLIGQILPDTPDGGWDALEFLTQAQQPDAALAVWNHFIEKKPSIRRGALFAFLDLLVAQDRFEEAGATWHQALALQSAPANASAVGPLVYDGGFESELSGGGFGWHQQDVDGAAFELDIAEKHSGARSARITFDGKQNLSYYHLYEDVLVQPRTRYKFQAFLRTDQISTDSGMRFEIRDPRRPQDTDVLTPNETGTQPWTLEEVEFTTGPQTHVVQITLRRVPSTHLDNQLSGTVWVDDVGLSPAGSK
jgi:tetratricopeptide (TPR) repeat protein